MKILLEVTEQFWGLENSGISWEGEARERLNWAPAQQAFPFTEYVPGGVWLTCQLSQQSVIFSKYGNKGHRQSEIKVACLSTVISFNEHLLVRLLLYYPFECSLSAPACVSFTSKCFLRGVLQTMSLNKPFYLLPTFQLELKLDTFLALIICWCT